MLPNFVILGAQKSGSTFLHMQLMRHPHVFMHEGETRSFEDPEYAGWDRARFEAMFEAGGAQKAIGIARPDYLARPEVPERLARHLPEARLIAVLRNPVDRALSAYFHQMRYGFLPARPAEEGLRRILRGEYAHSHPKAKEILAYGRYHAQLAHYERLFGRERILVLRFEDLTQRVDATIRRALRFLVLDPSLQPSAPLPSKDKNPGVYSMTRIRMSQLRHRVAFRYYAGGTKIAFDSPSPLHRRLLGKLAAAADRHLVAPLTPRRAPSISDALRDELRGYYADEIRALEAFLGESFGAWKVESDAVQTPSPHPMVLEPAPTHRSA